MVKKGKDFVGLFSDRRGSRRGTTGL